MKTENQQFEMNHSPLSRVDLCGDERPPEPPPPDGTCAYFGVPCSAWDTQGGCRLRTCAVFL